MDFTLDIQTIYYTARAGLKTSTHCVGAVCEVYSQVYDASTANFIASCGLTLSKNIDVPGCDMSSTLNISLGIAQVGEGSC